MVPLIGLTTKPEILAKDLHRPLVDCPGEGGSIWRRSTPRGQNPLTKRPPKNMLTSLQSNHPRRSFWEGWLGVIGKPRNPATKGTTTAENTATHHTTSGVELPHKNLRGGYAICGVHAVFGGEGSLVLHRRNKIRSWRGRSIKEDRPCLKELVSRKNKRSNKQSSKGFILVGVESG